MKKSKPKKVSDIPKKKFIKPVIVTKLVTDTITSVYGSYSNWSYSGPPQFGGT